MSPPYDRDFDYATLQRKLLAPAVETLRVADLYFRRHLGAKEIAALIGKPESTVRGIIHRARKKLGLA
ncbi:MAG: sigma factor-like helix-turn-helix DNA-binding protein [Acidobacteriota bacterium]